MVQNPSWLYSINFLDYNQFSSKSSPNWFLQINSQNLAFNRFSRMVAPSPFKTPAQHKRERRRTNKASQPCTTVFTREIKCCSLLSCTIYYIRDHQRVIYVGIFTRAKILFSSQLHCLLLFSAYRIIDWLKIVDDSWRVSENFQLNWKF
jgi:hypothetical protein